LSRHPFAFIPFPDNTAGSDLVAFLVRLFQNVQRAVVNSPSKRTLTIATTLKNGLSDENGLYRCDATAGAFPVTLPASMSSGDTLIRFKKIDGTANAVTITAQGSDTIEGAATKVLAAQYQAVTVQCRTGGWDILERV
jgi:hypothetical protein